MTVCTAGTLRSEIKTGRSTQDVHRGWFGAITTTIYVVYERARAQGPRFSAYPHDL
jgi:hypothetical protein